VAFPFTLPEIEAGRLRAAIGPQRQWSLAERRLLPVLVFAATCWVLLPLLKIPRLAGVEDSTIAIIAALALFVIPAGRREPDADPAETLLAWRDTLERVPNHALSVQCRLFLQRFTPAGEAAGPPEFFAKPPANHVRQALRSLRDPLQRFGNLLRECHRPNPIHPFVFPDQGTEILDLAGRRPA
jgi:hypothetical protein